MPSSGNTGDGLRIWVIERVDTREWLGSNDRVRGETMSFGARTPNTYSSLRNAREAWRAHCFKEGYLRLGITLPGRTRTTRVEPGPNASFTPPVQFRELETRSVSVYVEDRVPFKGDDDAE